MPRGSLANNIEARGSTPLHSLCMQRFKEHLFQPPYRQGTRCRRLQCSLFTSIVYDDNKRRTFLKILSSCKSWTIQGPEMPPQICTLLINTHKTNSPIPQRQPLWKLPNGYSGRSGSVLEAGHCAWNHQPQPQIASHPV